MTKSRFNLRKVATIIACLVVTMMFAACDKTNPDDDNGNGNGNGGGEGRELTAEEKKLVGNWCHIDDPLVWGADPNTQIFELYIFTNDGKFVRKYVGSTRTGYIVGLRLSVHEKGTWRVSDGKIHFTNVTYSESNDIIDPPGPAKNWTAWKKADSSNRGYFLDSDEWGGFLGVFIDESKWRKYYKDKMPPSPNDRYLNF